MDLLLTAIDYIGTKEIPGQRHNSTIVGFLQSVAGWIVDDETPWCSAFMNWVANRAGFEYTGRLDARSWLKAGEEVKEPKKGDVVIFWRESPESWKGHVGVFVRMDENYVWVLGGNQSNEVNIKPYRRDRVLGFRRLKKRK